MRMVPRALQPLLQERATRCPLITLSGPRQAGKTWLARTTFPDHEYVDLENANELDHARLDPRDFLMRFRDHVIIDEAQAAQGLMPHLQAVAKRDRRPARFVLVGSERSLPALAAADADLRLWPLSRSEVTGRPPLDLDGFGMRLPISRMPRQPDPDLMEVLLAGGFPAIHASGANPERWLAAYFRNSVETDLAREYRFTEKRLLGRFIRLCAGRNSQVLNLTALAADCGISRFTAKHWITSLADHHIITLLEPCRQVFHHRPFKSPRLYFLDTGLLCHLLRIRSAVELSTHSARGAIFKTFVLSELIKNRDQRGIDATIGFWREPRGRGVDLVVNVGGRSVPVEIKSGRNMSPDFVRDLDHWQRLAGLPTTTRGIVFYGGLASRPHRGHLVYSWTAL